jgi:diguanylate cyclase
VTSGAVACSALVVVRQLVAFADNARLLEQLDAKVVELGGLLRERDDLAARLRHQTLHDPLTGLANRTLLNGELLEALAGQAAVAVVLVDLDGFKPVNDRYGHGTGDELLVAVGRRLRSCARQGDVVARLGGDEFVVLLRGPADEVGRFAEELARRVVGVLGRPFTLDPVTVRISSSVGVASSGPGHTADELLQAADGAMYQAKRSGKNCYRMATAVAPAIEPTPNP